MKIKVLISILALLYILFIIVMWQFQLIIPGVAGIIFGALYEMTVIPVFFLVPVLTVLFGVLWIREGFKKKSESLYAFLISFVALLLIILMTIQDLKDWF